MEEIQKVNSSLRDVQYEKVWKALAKYGIRTEAELNDAVKKMKPLNIGCMVSVRNESEAVV